MMKKFIESLEIIEDKRQSSKVRHKIQDVICIDGKTMRGNAGKNRKANHIVTAWCDESGYSLGEKKVDEKSNEIKAIPDLLETIKIKGNVITIDAMGTQTNIAEKIKNKGADYVLLVKESQKNLYKEIKDYLNLKRYIIFQRRNNSLPRWKR